MNDKNIAAQGFTGFQSERDFIDAVLTNIGALMVVLDRDGRIVRFNQSCERLTGYTFEEVRGAKVQDLFIRPEQIHKVEAILRSINAGAPSMEADIQWMTRDGIKHMVRWVHTAILNPDSDTPFIIATGLDITVQYAHEKVLSSKTKRYQTIIETSFDWDYWINTERRFVYVSPSCELVAGYKPIDFYKDPELMVTIVHPEEREAVRVHFQNTSETERCHMDFRIITRDGTHRWISHHCKPVYDADGTFQGRRGSNRDITWRKDAEAALRNRTEELAQKTHDLKEANLALKLMLDQRHVEIRAVEENLYNNLRRHISPYIDKLEACAVPPEARTYIDIIRDNLFDLVTPRSDSFTAVCRNMTPTEIHVADLIRQGKSSKEIAELLGVSPSTVAIHRNHIRRKLNLLNKRINLQSYFRSLSA